MATEAEKATNSGIDRFLWLLVFALVAGAVYGNYYFGGEPVLYRALGLVLIGLVTVALAFQTTSGRAFKVLLRDARIEVRKVIWPTRTETTQTTMVVLVAVLVTSLMLWAIDSLLSWAVSSVIS